MTAFHLLMAAFEVILVQYNRHKADKSASSFPHYILSISMDSYNNPTPAGHLSLISRVSIESEILRQRIESGLVLFITMSVIILVIPNKISLHFLNWARSERSIALKNNN